MGSSRRVEGDFGTLRRSSRANYNLIYPCTFVNATQADFVNIALRLYMLHLTSPIFRIGS